jgi:hypothetical protein
MVLEGPWYHDYFRKRQDCYGTVTTLAKPSIRPIVNLGNDM